MILDFGSPNNVDPKDAAAAGIRRVGMDELVALAREHRMAHLVRLAPIRAAIDERLARLRSELATRSIGTRLASLRHTAELVVSGEVPLALTVYNYKAQQLKAQGAPIDWFSIGSAIARPNGVGVARKAPHPHAAVLFYDFEISPEGQAIIAGREFVPTSKKIDTPLNKMPMNFVDAKVSIDEYDKWKNLYRQLFGIRGT